ncbi:hypothetical protein [Sphingomonas sp. Leaf10]|uniref:hypothetical protein n=1 Tax=Sphingomonas sp. Leaf10 TaxID=1735676 RepID=UPI0019110759|nr:hypothetical protein [Sphingomonas sp. Leaf10]
MIAIGCLLLVILPIVGLALGGLIAGPAAARWGAAIGFGIALLVCGITGRAFARMRQDR